MTGYGIKIVWKGWKDEPVIGFSPWAYKRWKGAITPGTRMLVYESSEGRGGVKLRGARAIIGEVEVTGTFEDGDNYQAPTPEHSHLVPVKVLRGKETVKPIPLTTIREILKQPKYPLQSQSWQPITEAEYKALLALWD